MPAYQVIQVKTISHFHDGRTMQQVVYQLQQRQSPAHAWANLGPQAATEHAALSHIPPRLEVNHTVVWPKKVVLSELPE